MFPVRFFPNAMFAPRYWPKAGEDTQAARLVEGAGPDAMWAAVAGPRIQYAAAAGNSEQWVTK